MTCPARQEQFLDVIDRDEAERRFRAALDLRPLEAERIPLYCALGRVLAADVVAPVDVPGFDRSNVDGFAVRAADTFGAEEERPVRLHCNAEELAPGSLPQEPLGAGTATVIATGAAIPRQADAVVMVEYTESVGEWESGRVRAHEGGSAPALSPVRSPTLALSHSPTDILVRRPVAPGANITYAGTDIGRGETVLRRGELLTARETGVLAALGLDHVMVVRRPSVAILSTGNELVAPGQAIQPGQVYDSNATILADTVREIGGEPVLLGIVPDDAELLHAKLQTALRHDVVLLSGGTSKGAGDVSYRVVAELGAPGIVAHGVALKPGKPLCLAVVGKVPVVVLPGFPTSAIFTFHEFVAPVIRAMAGRSEEPVDVVHARLPVRVNSERGRTEYLLVSLVQVSATRSQESGVRSQNVPDKGTEPAEGASLPPDSCRVTPDSCALTPDPRLAAYPMGKGSGSVTTFSRADGFVTIPRQREYLDGGEIVEVRLLGHGLRPADLVVIGSHCVGLDCLLGRLHDQGIRSKFLAVGSTGGLTAARRGECDLAGIHLFDPKSGTYNRPFLSADLVLIPGYGRLQGIVFQPGDPRFLGRPIAEAVANALADPACVLVNRNRGSGTRVLIDGLLGSARPPGHGTEARSHNAVAAAVIQGRADWGVCIETVARDAGLGFLPLQDEQFDFAVGHGRNDRPAVQAFQRLLTDPATRQALSALGFRMS